MKLFKLNWTRRAKQPPTSPDSRAYTPETIAWLGGRDEPSGVTLTNAYQQVVWVYRAVNALAEQVANVPFRFSVGKAGGEQLITSGPLLDFYDRPHPHLNRFQYWELRVIWLMLRGECFRVPVFQDSGNGRRTLKSVLLLDPANFEHVIEDNRLTGWRYRDASRNAPLPSQVFLPEEVWFERLPNPWDFWRGMAPLQVAALAAGMDFAAGAFMKGLMENNAYLVDEEDPVGPELAGASLVAFERWAGQDMMVDDLVPTIEARGSRAALNVLVAMANVATGRLATAAAEAAQRLVLLGVQLPAWADEVRKPVTLSECFAVGDARDNDSLLVVTFTRRVPG